MSSQRTQGSEPMSLSCQEQNADYCQLQGYYILFKQKQNPLL